MSVKVNDVIGVAGFVDPGTRVDVMVTIRRKEDSTSRTVVSNVQVLTAGTRVDQERQGRQGESACRGRDAARDARGRRADRARAVRRADHAVAAQSARHRADREHGRPDGGAVRPGRAEPRRSSRPSACAGRRLRRRRPSWRRLRRRRSTRSKPFARPSEAKRSCSSERQSTKCRTRDRIAGAGGAVLPPLAATAGGRRRTAA